MYKKQYQRGCTGITKTAKSSQIPEQGSIIAQIPQ